MFRLLAAISAAMFLLFSAASSQTPLSQPDSNAADNQNMFAFDLYSHLRSQQGNLFFSPESVSLSLAILYAGSAGQTEKEIAQTLHFSPDQRLLHAAMTERLNALNKPEQGNGDRLTLANALWLQDGFPFKTDFLKLVQRQYDATLRQVNFAAASDAALHEINAWASQATANKITNLLQPGILKSNTRLVLTNAIYFKGSWLKAFDKTATSDEDFYTTASGRQTVPMMHGSGDYLYWDSGTFQILELPYRADDLSMIVILPASTDGLSALEGSLTQKSWETWLTKLHPVAHLQLIFPRFKIKADFQLNDTLSAMGMPLAFQETQADFSRMANFPKEQNLYLSSVVHKAFVDVNEEGTEAAAATGAVAGSRAMFRPIVFRADRPFLFTIRENRSGHILFIGRLTEPH